MRKPRTTATTPPSETASRPSSGRSRLSQGVMAFAIDVGRPLVRQSFPGPEAHKLTANEYAYQLGVCTIGCELGLIETTELETIDSHLPKVRFDAPFEKEKP